MDFYIELMEKLFLSEASINLPNMLIWPKNSDYHRQTENEAEGLCGCSHLWELY